MKQPQTIALTAILAVAVGMIGLNGVQGDLFTVNSASTTNGEVGMLGHVIVTHFDKDGNVQSYQQMDNTITVVGKNCAVNLIFGTGFANCTTPGLFANIALSDIASTHVDEDTSLSGECNGGANICGAGLDARNGAGVTVSASVVGIDGTDPIVEVSATFTKSVSGTTTMLAAGLFDDSSTESGNMFAAQDFGSGVAMGQDESIQVDWLITLAAPKS